MAEKKWHKITMQSEPVLVEPLTDFLIGVIGAGVETGAVDEKNFGVIRCYVQEPEQETGSLTGILESISQHARELADIFQVAEPALRVEVLEDEDWGKSWKVHFKPFAIIPKLIIVPSWEEYQPLPDEKVIVMDPGMAFGTGHHATTSLSVELLADTVASFEAIDILDIGTGTGVLGMAALKFGAHQAYGIDNDPEAVSAAAENIARNKLQTRMQVSCEPLQDVKRSYPVVVANIVHDVLVEMAEDIGRLTEHKGWLILSGILVGQQAENILRLYKKHGFGLVDKRSREEWCALRLQKNGS